MTHLVPANDVTEARVVSKDSIVWFVNSMGYGSQLLYWGEILPGYIEAFPNSQFWTAVYGDKPIPTTDKTVRQVSSWHMRLGKRRQSYDRQLAVVSPQAIRTIRHANPSLVVISEFTMPSLYVALMRRWLDCKVMLLVESDPLRGNTNRIGKFKQSLRRFVAKRADLVLTNNSAGEQYVAEHLNVPSEKIFKGPYVVSRGASDSSVVSGDVAAARQQLSAGERTVFLYVGQLVERKGVDELIQAVSSLEQTVRDQMAVWLVGDGEQREFLQRQVELHGLNECVTLVGRVDYKEIAKYYGAADVFVMPTLDDYRALVGFEAIGFGLPLLHSIYDGAVGEVVEEGRNGWRIDPRDRAGFAAKMAWCVDHHDRLESMATVSREIASGYSVEVAVDTLVTATKRCLAT